MLILLFRHTWVSPRRRWSTFTLSLLPMNFCSCASSQSSSGVVTSTWPSSMVCTCKLFGYCLVCWRLLGQRLQLAKIRSSWFLTCTFSNKFCYFPDSLQCYDTRTREDIPNTYLILIAIVPEAKLVGCVGMCMTRPPTIDCHTKSIFKDVKYSNEAKLC